MIVAQNRLSHLDETLESVTLLYPNDENLNPTIKQQTDLSGNLLIAPSVDELSFCFTKYLFIANLKLQEMFRRCIEILSDATVKGTASQC